MNIDIFVSRPNNLDENQERTMQKIEGLLGARGMRVRTIGKTDFPNVSPMKAVEQLMRQCSGAIILGFPQTKIQRGISKPNTESEKTIKDTLLPTPWNHIEASMAFVLDLPMLVIRDKGLEGGVFDIGVTGYFIHTFQLENQEWIEKPSFLQPFNDWYKDAIHKLESKAVLK
ncbi:hypothetical protein [Bacillus sp. FJAT-25509]|uniref:hypothetical protein n=1 Tax=Bacillus sp. FJAT-25509 TaxID=1712029 RepID=UPI0006FED5A2|nr:hypothetical protein [Bacillus sp. FJAT-25509]